MTGSEKTLTDRLESLILPIVEEMGLELVELQYRREGSGWVLRLIIDKEGGVSLDDCAEVSREAGRVLEVEEILDHAYRLEVSSPGLERPLRKEKEYLQFRGSKAKIKTTEPINKQWVFVGTIADFCNGEVTLHTDAGDLMIPLDKIAKARLVFDF
jgi:ribosome maturation factor RimP